MKYTTTIFLSTLRTLKTDNISINIFSHLHKCLFTLTTGDILYKCKWTRGAFHHTHSLVICIQKLSTSLLDKHGRFVRCETLPKSMVHQWSKELTVSMFGHFHMKQNGAILVAIHTSGHVSQTLCAYVYITVVCFRTSFFFNNDYATIYEKRKLAQYVPFNKWYLHTNMKQLDLIVEGDRNKRLYKNNAFF